MASTAINTPGRIYPRLRTRERSPVRDPRRLPVERTVLAWLPPGVIIILTSK